MSLLDFVNLPDVKQELNRILPEYQRNPRVVRVVDPRNDDGGIRRTIGTAFDYAFRIELERRTGRVQQKPWVAEAGLAKLKRRAQVAPTLARMLRAAGLPVSRSRRLWGCGIGNRRRPLGVAVGKLPKRPAKSSQRASAEGSSWTTPQ